jgi:ParB family chromosome partitioning protein
MTKNGEISAGHARALLALENDAMIYEAAQNIVNNKLTVRDVERLAKIKDNAGSVPQKRNRRRDSFYERLSFHLPRRSAGELRFTRQGKGHP